MSAAPLNSFNQLQGGCVPSEQTTVVCEFAGTMTVVAGAAGRLLLMQPVKVSRISAAVRIFMAGPQVKTGWIPHVACRAESRQSSTLQQMLGRGCNWILGSGGLAGHRWLREPTVGSRLRVSASPALGACLGTRRSDRK